MNRRQFLGASLCASIASAVLPWDRFIAWWKSWFIKATEAVKRESRLLSSWNEAMKIRYPKIMPDVIWLNPDAYEALRRELA